MKAWVYAVGHFDGDGCTFPTPGHMVRPSSSFANPVLSAFRDDPESNLPFKVDEWLGGIADYEAERPTAHCWHHVQVRDSGATPEQVESARRVLTRLRNVTEAGQ